MKLCTDVLSLSNRCWAARIHGDRRRGQEEGKGSQEWARQLPHLDEPSENQENQTERKTEQAQTQTSRIWQNVLSTFMFFFLFKHFLLSIFLFNSLNTSGSFLCDSLENDETFGSIRLTVAQSFKDLWREYEEECFNFSNKMKWKMVQSWSTTKRVNCCANIQYHELQLFSF